MFLSRFFYFTVSSNQTTFARSVPNTISKFYFCSSTILQKKNDSSPEPETIKTTLLNLPQKPKKPTSSFVRFSLAMRPTILKENPTIRNEEVLKVASKLWQNCDVETRVQFQVEYYTDLEKYYDELQKYNSSLTEEQIIALKKFEIRKKENRIRKKIKDKIKELQKPKRPMNAYTLFLVSKKNELKRIRADVYCHQLVKEWNELPENEKKKFRMQGNKLQEDYKQKLAEWKERVGPFNIMHILRNEGFEKAKEYLNEKPMVDPDVVLEEK